jgi:hypothetical protein
MSAEAQAPLEREDNQALSTALTMAAGTAAGS